MRLDGAPAIRFQPEWKGYLEAVNAGSDSQVADRCAYSISFRLESMPPEGAAYGLFGRGDGSAGNTSFGIYVESDGKVLAHVRTTTNFAKGLSSEPGLVAPKRPHTLVFALDKPDGTLSLTLDGKVIATGGIAHDSPEPQSLRWRSVPLRIGYVKVGPDEWAPSQPDPQECYLDGYVTGFRIERL